MIGERASLQVVSFCQLLWHALLASWKSKALVVSSSKYLPSGLAGCCAQSWLVSEEAEEEKEEREEQRRFAS